MKKTLTIALLLFVPNLAIAHGDAKWIMDGKYYQPGTNTHCCGLNDCKKIPKESILEEGGGFKYIPTGELIPYKDVHVSETLDYWRCEFLSGPQKGKTRCLFSPVGGT